MEEENDKLELFVAYAKDVLSKGDWWAIQQIYDDMEEYDIGEDETQFAWTLILPDIYRWMVASLTRIKNSANLSILDPENDDAFYGAMQIVEFLDYVKYLRRAEGLDFLQRYLDKAMQRVGLTKVDVANIIMDHVYKNWTPDTARRVAGKSADPDSMSIKDALLHLGLPVNQVRQFIDSLSDMKFLKEKLSKVLSKYDKKTVIKYILTTMKQGRTDEATKITDLFIAAGFAWPELATIKAGLVKSSIHGNE